MLREHAGKIAVCQLLRTFWTWTGGCPLLETDQILAASTHLGVCVSFWGVSVCMSVCKQALGGWKAVSNDAKMPGTGDY